MYVCASWQCVCDNNFIMALAKLLLKCAMLFFEVTYVLHILYVCVCIVPGCVCVCQPVIIL